MVVFSKKNCQRLKLVALPLSAIRRSVFSDVLVKESITAQT